MTNSMRHNIRWAALMTAVIAVGITMIDHSPVMGGIQIGMGIMSLLQKLCMIVMDWPSRQKQ